MAFLKTILRMFKSNFGRFIAVTAIMAVGIALMTGIGEVGPAMKSGGDDYLVAQNVPDIIVKSTSQTGFTDEQIDNLTSLDFAEDSLTFTAVDMELGEDLTRMYFLPLQSMSLCKIELLDGRLPTAANKILAERSTHGLVEREVGDKITFYGAEFTVAGITLNPLMFAKEPEPSTVETDSSTWADADEAEYRDLDAVIYFDSALTGFPMLSSIRTDIYITVGGARDYNIFSKGYEDLISDAKADIEAATDDIKVLTLEENYSYAFYKANIEKIVNISFIIPVFFAAVVALVILTTMTRLVEKERPVVGCYKTLGISNNKIRLKYMLFILICFVLGSVVGLVIGSLVIMPIIHSAYNIIFELPGLNGGIFLTFGVIAAGIILVVVAAMTLYVISKQVKEKPAELLKAKAPKPGKKILLEKIPIIWNRLKFKYKSTMRNIFRNAKNFIMTVISVAGSTALVLAGFGLYDAAGSDSTTVSGTTGRVSESISLISVVIIICAAALSILVMYNLTNMIIEERRREIATLKVLGYKNIELAGYVFREVFIMALVGVLIGLPLGVLLIGLVFEYVNFGALSDIHWYSYVAAFVVAIAFIALVFVVLYRKIVKTDMNASLKSTE